MFWGGVQIIQVLARTQGPASLLESPGSILLAPGALLALAGLVLLSAALSGAAFSYLHRRRRRFLDQLHEEALASKRAAEQTLGAILLSFSTLEEPHLKDSLSRALDPVARLVGVDRCLMLEVGRDQDALEVICSWAPEGHTRLGSSLLGDRLSALPRVHQDLLAGCMVHVPDLAKNPEGLEALAQGWAHLDLGSILLVPQLVDHRLCGVLVFATVGRQARWTGTDRQLLEGFSSLHGAGLRRESDRRERALAHQKFESIVEFLPDATFVVNSSGAVVAWNRAMEDLTGVPKEEILGQGQYAHALPFYGERVPTLINHFGDADLGNWRQLYDFVEVSGTTLYAECFVPRLNEGKGAFLWSTACALYDEDEMVIGAIQSLRDVTYRKKAEQALRNSEERYRHLVEAMNEGMGVVSANGVITYANNSLCRMLRVEKGQILGARLRSLFPQLRPTESLESWDGWQASPMEVMELDIPRADGTTFPARLSPTAIHADDGSFMGGFAIISDLTTIREVEAKIRKLNESLEQRVAAGTRELREANSALRESEERYRRIIESLSEGYIFYSQDTGRHFTYVSPSYRTLLGYDDLEQLSQGLAADMRRPANRNSRAMAEKSALGFRQSPWDMRVSCRDGQERIMEILEVPVFDKGGQVTSIEGICHDVTEARHNQELVQQAQRKLVEQEKLAALGSLVAGLSHEINTPVGIGVTAASHLSSEVDQVCRAYGKDQLTRDNFESFLESSRESAALIASNLYRAADLLKNFKSVACDHPAGGERVFKLKEYLEDVIRSFSPRLRNTGFHIRLECPEDLEMTCDPASLYQIISNLIMNSLTHGFEGMLVGQINISARIEAEGLVLCYSDNGNGMNRGDLSRIYEPFFTTKRGRGGTGLGMHIVYNNVTRNLGGNISCASKPGRGARFTMTVPLLAEVEHG